MSLWLKKKRQNIQIWSNGQVMCLLLTIWISFIFYTEILIIYNDCVRIWSSIWTYTWYISKFSEINTFISFYISDRKLKSEIIQMVNSRQQSNTPASLRTTKYISLQRIIHFYQQTKGAVTGIKLLSNVCQYKSNFNIKTCFRTIILSKYFFLSFFSFR